MILKKRKKKKKEKMFNMDKEKNIILIEIVFLCFYRSSHISTRATISVLKVMLYFSQTFIFLSILLDCEFQEDRVSTLFNITKFSVEFVLTIFVEYFASWLQYHPQTFNFWLFNCLLNLQSQVELMAMKTI